MTTASRFKNPTTAAYAIMVLLVVIMFHLLYGLEVLVPTNINWLMSARHDWGQHYLGWAFYRDEPWHFPLGEMDRVIYPAGTNVGYWDSIPLLALFFKIFSFALPENFQYLGLWLLFCYLMTAHYTFKILRLYNINYILVVLAVLLVVGNPMLFYRGMHPALCAHGFILASIYYYLEPANAANAVGINKKQIWLLAISSMVNPYICLMVIGFNFILPLKHYIYGRFITKKQAWTYPLISCGAVLLCWVLFGMVTFGSGESLEVRNSYGVYPFNYNSFFNGGGFSAIFPQMPWVSPHQYESYMYMGLGLLVLTAGAFVYFLIAHKPVQFAKTHRWLLPLLVLTVALGLFATTHIVTYNDHVLFEVPLPKFIKKLGGIFRASARFYWIAYYLICLFALILLFKSRLPLWAKATVASLTILLQVYDVKPLYTFRHLPYGDYDSPLDEAKWNAVLPHFDRMITYPPFNNHLLNPSDYQDLCMLALKNHNAISAGYSAREDSKAYKRYTDSLTSAMANGTLQPNELYVTTPQYLDAFGNLLNKHQMTVQYLDGYYLLYLNNKSIPVISKSTNEAKQTDSIARIYARSSFVRDIKITAYANDKIALNPEEVSVNEKDIRIKGWAYLKASTNNKGDSVFVITANDANGRVGRTVQVKRPDLTSFFKKENLEDSGFSAALFSDEAFSPDTHLVIGIKSKGTFTFADLGTLNSLNKDKKPVKAGKLPGENNQMGNIDSLAEENGIWVLNGWSAFKDESSTANELRIVLVKGAETYTCATNATKRPDVTGAMGKNKYNFDNSGFETRIKPEGMPGGTYTLGILLKNPKTGKQSVLMTDKTITVK